MTDVTPLDTAHARMEESDAARLGFFSTLADTTLFLLLEREAEGDQIEPRLFPTEEGEIVLAFDSEDRLADFADGPAAYVALPGRIVAQLLGSQGLGLGLNLEVAPSSMLLPAPALVWLTETLEAGAPDSIEARITALEQPNGVPEMLLEALGAQFAQSPGLAERAVLAAVTYEGGGRGHLLGILGSQARAETALARSVKEALTFSGVEAGFLDVGFFDTDHAIVERLMRAGLHFEIPALQMPEPATAKAPGSDPDKPPRLR